MWFETYLTKQYFLLSSIFLSEDVPYFLGWISFYSMTLKMSSLSVFLEKIIFAFLIEGSYHTFRKNKYHLYQKYRKHLFLFFAKKWSFIFCIKNKIIFFGKKKYHISWQCKKNHIPMQFFWKDHLFRTFSENIIFQCIFLREIIFHFSFTWYYRKGHIPIQFYRKTIF